MRKWRVEIKIRRKKDGQFVKILEEFPGYRHVVTTTDQSSAIDFSETECIRICDHDFLGKPYHDFKMGATNRRPEFERFRL